MVTLMLQGLPDHVWSFLPMDSTAVRKKE
jgi:hypothetical protein